MLSLQQENQSQPLRLKGSQKYCSKAKYQRAYNRFGIKLTPIIFLKTQFINKRDSRLIKSIVNEGILIAGRNLKGINSMTKRRGERIQYPLCPPLNFTSSVLYSILKFSIIIKVR